MRETAGGAGQPAGAPRLRELCFRAVRSHLAALGCEAVLDLPQCLIKDLLPHLTVCQLDTLQPRLNRRGISTHAGWAGFLQEMCGPNHAADFHTEDEAKHEVMRMLFTLVFYGFTNGFVKRNLTNLSTPSFLWAAAKCIKHFLLISSLHKPLQSLAAEQRPLLSLLEGRVGSVGVSESIDLSKRTTQTALYVLHRLLDHGLAKKLVVHMHCPLALACLLHGRGSQYVDPALKNLMSGGKDVSDAASAGVDRTGTGTGTGTGSSEGRGDGATACKRSRLESAEEGSEKADLIVDPQRLCRAFGPCDGPPAGPCPSGQIDCLEIRSCRSDSLKVLNSALPTFFCLRSLTLHSFSTFRDSDVSELAGALRRLSDSSRSALTDLNVGILPYTRLIKDLLDASPRLTALHVDILTVMWGPHVAPHHPRAAQPDASELPLEKLTVKVAELQTDLHFITSVLRRSPRLTSLHISGVRLPTGSSLSQLLALLSESNRCLKSLSLEDMKLSDCLPEILNLLRVCALEELRLNDCRLLEKWSDKEQSLQQLVSAVKTVPSLHTLSLAQNRLAKNICVLAELFSGSSPSSVRRLDVSSNFIQPAELLEFARRLRKHRPPQRLTLDLRKNPGDRDPDTWNCALRRLRPLGVLLVEGWKSTDTMVDHISNM